MTYTGLGPLAPHDVLCPNPTWCEDNGGFACNLIESGRVDGIQMAEKAIHQALPGTGACDTRNADLQAVRDLLTDDTPQED